jgi:hypothetical protein
MFSRPLLLLAATLPAPAHAAPAEPAPTYSVVIRYQIDAFRKERVQQYFDMLKALEAAGFKRDEKPRPEPTEPEDPNAPPLRGVVAADRVTDVLGERHVRSIRLIPAGEPPPDGAAPVRVHLQLAGGYAPERQQQLAAQTLRVLRALGFQEGVAYDHRDHTRLVGAIPADKLDALLGDLRRQPAAWALLPTTLLNDLRAQVGGPDQLEALLLTWYDHPEGKQLVVKSLLEPWVLKPSGEDFIGRQRPELFKGTDRTVLHERAITQLVRERDASDLLDRLLADVLASKAAPELMDPLLKRLRGPAGAALPVFFRTPSAVLVTEVRPKMDLPAARPAPPAVPADLEKVDPDLRALLPDAAKAAAPTRLEVLLAEAPADDEAPWERALRAAAPGLVVEGRVGSLATVVARPDQVKALAARPEVAYVRLPRVAHARLRPAEAVEGWEPLQAAGLARLHAANNKGKGTRVAVVDADFRGWEALVGKRLPEGTRLVDLTRARNADLEPDATPGDPAELGHGVHVALAVLRAAPEADVTLVRIDPAAPYMLEAVARAINGEPALADLLRRRLEELQDRRAALDAGRDKLAAERKEALAAFVDEGQKDALLKIKKERESRGLKLTPDEQLELERILRKEDYLKHRAEWEADEKAYRERVGRNLQLAKDLGDFKDVRVVASALTWDEGHPAGGNGALSRYFEERPFRAALWFQSAGDNRGQAWTGPFRDADGDGVMEFAPPGPTATAGTWAREANFLAWRAPDGKEARDLPKDARVRVSLQWREAHDPDVNRPGEDLYAKPLADLRIVILRQTDPDGAKRAADDFEVVAESAGLPQRLEATPTSATYEITVELPPQMAPGRYAIRVEGRAPRSTRPHDLPTLPAAERTFELRPRLFLETRAGDGRAVFQSYPTEAGALGVPADSHGVITVGAADAAGKPEPYATAGPPAGAELARKPDVWAFDRVEVGKDALQGPGLAAGFAAGAAATTVGAGAPVCDWAKALGVPPGEALRVPADWRPRR